LSSLTDGLREAPPEGAAAAAGLAKRLLDYRTFLANRAAVERGGASLAHVHAFEEAHDPDHKGERAAQVAEQTEAEGVEQGDEDIHE
jgi:hypothetical protein